MAGKAGNTAHHVTKPMFYWERQERPASNSPQCLCDGVCRYLDVSSVYKDPSLYDLKDPTLTSWNLDVLCPCPNWSELFWQNEDQLDINYNVMVDWRPDFLNWWCYYNF